jgi:hypothetical protein
MKTAVEWLINEMPVIDWQDPYWKIKLDKAKEMEKENIMDAHFEGSEDYRRQYYNETFKQSNSPEIPTSSNQQTQDNNFLVWDKLFAKLAWRFKPMKSGDMFIDAEAVYEELKNEFNLTFKQ